MKYPIGPDRFGGHPDDLLAELAGVWKYVFWPEQITNMEWALTAGLIFARVRTSLLYRALEKGIAISLGQEERESSSSLPLHQRILLSPPLPPPLGDPPLVNWASIYMFFLNTFCGSECWVPIWVWVGLSKFVLDKHLGFLFGLNFLKQPCILGKICYKALVFIWCINWTMRGWKLWCILCVRQKLASVKVLKDHPLLSLMKWVLQNCSNSGRIEVEF